MGGRGEPGEKAREISRELVEEFNHTRPRHGGYIEYAAPIFGVTEASLEKALGRARQRGLPVRFERRPKW
jgi:hypothetical protein